MKVFICLIVGKCLTITSREDIWNYYYALEKFSSDTQKS